MLILLLITCTTAVSGAPVQDNSLVNTLLPEAYGAQEGDSNEDLDYYVQEDHEEITKEDELNGFTKDDFISDGNDEEVVEVVQTSEEKQKLDQEFLQKMSSGVEQGRHDSYQAIKAGRVLAVYKNLDEAIKDIGARGMLGKVPLVNLARRNGKASKRQKYMGASRFDILGAINTGMQILGPLIAGAAGGGGGPPPQPPPEERMMQGPPPGQGQPDIGGVIQALMPVAEALLPVAMQVLPQVLG